MDRIGSELGLSFGADHTLHRERGGYVRDSVSVQSLLLERSATSR